MGRCLRPTLKKLLARVKSYSQKLASDVEHRSCERKMANFLENVEIVGRSCATNSKKVCRSAEKLVAKATKRPPEYTPE